MSNKNQSVALPRCLDDAGRLEALEFPFLIVSQRMFFKWRKRSPRVAIVGKIAPWLSDPITFTCDVIDEDKMHKLNVSQGTTRSSKQAAGVRWRRSGRGLVEKHLTCWLTGKFRLIFFTCEKLRRTSITLLKYLLPTIRHRFTGRAPNSGETHVGTRPQSIGANRLNK